MTGIWAAQPEDGRFAIVTKTVYVLITRMWRSVFAVSSESFPFLCTSDPSTPHTEGTNLLHKTNRARYEEDTGRLRKPVAIQLESWAENISDNCSYTVCQNLAKCLLFCADYSQKPKLYIEGNQAIKIEHKVIHLIKYIQVIPVILSTFIY
jgi:hypothetical protein